MPIFEYRCVECENEFELFVRKDATDAACPSCGGQQLQKLFSTSMVSTIGTKLRSYHQNEHRKKRQQAERDHDTHDHHHDH